MSLKPWLHTSHHCCTICHWSPSPSRVSVFPSFIVLQLVLRRTLTPCMQAAWLLSNVTISFLKDPGKDVAGNSDALATRVTSLLRRQRPLPLDSITVLRKTFDPRRRKADGGVFMYVVLVDAQAVAAAGGAEVVEQQGLRVRCESSSAKCWSGLSSFCL